MGYTHYYKLNKPLTNEVILEIKSVLNKYMSIIQYEDDDNRTPKIDTEFIRFNGVNDDGHETFVVKYGRDEFCKTAEKPYDVSVCEVLLILKGYYRENFELDSDGFWVGKEDFAKDCFDGYWNKALGNVKKLGYDFDITHEISSSNGYSYYHLGIK